ncbi:MarR family transcriptional regulator [Maritimibacter sp. 55A14]|uniref:MarR family winged helix-turn-helix transcriptional regulator n=1 Tax=Maritimibacter sp. 55A14 TaxID=2174844 RepID=UPI000D61B890|nr:MarR family winged helix-turn-helix transcriptional regulator [Maritimibacter sp. 55A14]PWE32524.1 MarR family transcriptional regulator [Maritimibacter sp. 55A14]
MSDFDLDAFLPYQVNVLAARMSREFAERYRARFGISVAEWRVVAHLSQTGPVSVREIHARVDMDKSKVSRAAQRLEAAGYLRKRPHPGDRRLVELSLTPKGQAMMAELTEIAKAYQTDLAARLDGEKPAFQAAIQRLLDRDGAEN